MLVCGTAGTGKSFLISAIFQCLGDKCLLTGTTGMAAYNIGGKTKNIAFNLTTSNTSNQSKGTHRKFLAKTTDAVQRKTLHHHR